MRAKICILQSILLWSFGLAIESNTLQYKMTCGPNEMYSNCQSCEKTCFDPHPSCNSSCVAGCFCKEGLFRAPSGQCIELKLCPKAEITISDNELSVEDCMSDEVFVWCGWCEGTCVEPRPSCPHICTRGCVCRPPLLRHQSGHCVEETACAPKKCIDPNEEYGCRYGCEVRCRRRLCVRPRRCRLGCHCRLGLFRDSQGRCVTYDQCLQQPNATNQSLINV